MKWDHEEPSKKVASVMMPRTAPLFPISSSTHKDHTDLETQNRCLLGRVDSKRLEIFSSKQRCRLELSVF